MAPEHASVSHPLQPTAPHSKDKGREVCIRGGVGLGASKRWTTQIALVVVEGPVAFCVEVWDWCIGLGLTVSRVGTVICIGLASHGGAWEGEGGQIVLARPHCCHFWSLGSLMLQEGKCPLRATGTQLCQGWMLFQRRMLHNDVPGMGMGQREAQNPVREGQTCVQVAESGRHSPEAEAVLLLAGNKE